jgi:RNA polymerase sigma factor (sigma-70 family)
LLCLRENPSNERAWQEFVDRYRPRIYAHCLAVSLQQADAEDVTQAVLLRLVDKLRCFRYDPAKSFRAWLRTVTRHAVSDFLSERRNLHGSGDAAIVRMLESVEASDGLIREVEAEFDRELLDAALTKVRPRVSVHQWDAFRLTALEGLSGTDAGARLGMLVVTVYTAKSKVQKLVREELRRLEDQLDMK